MELIEILELFIISAGTIFFFEGVPHCCGVCHSCKVLVSFEYDATILVKQPADLPHDLKLSDYLLEVGGGVRPIHGRLSPRQIHSATIKMTKWDSVILSANKMTESTTFVLQTVFVSNSIQKTRQGTMHYFVQKHILSRRSLEAAAPYLNDTNWV